MEPADPRTPTELPHWSIGHVMTHIARNADSTIRMLAGLPQYWKGVESRASDIELGAGRTWDELVDDVVATNDAVDRCMREVTDWTGSVRATTAVRPKVTVPEMRRREVEIHHVDLDAGYHHRDWPEDFCIELLDLVTANHADSPDSGTFTIRATDTVRTWHVGAEQPVVEGTAADLAWWLVGRGQGEGLGTDAGELPRLGPWGRPTQAK